MKAAILGPGAVGGFLAALFWKNKIAVRCIAKAETVRAIRKNGLTLKSKTFGNFTAWPEVREQLSEPADIIFITVKAPSLNGAIKKIDPVLTKNSVIIPLLNGLAHIEPLKKRYGENVIAGTIGAVEIFQKAPGVIIHSSGRAKIELASDYKDIKNRLPAIAELISRIGIETRVLKKEAEIVWRKLVRLNAIACVTAATGKPIGVLRTDPVWRSKIEGAVSEAAAAAKAEAVILDVREVMSQVDRVEPEQMSSLARDIAQGKPSELESIAGAILKKCAQAKISCLTISELYNLIKNRSARLSS